MRMIAQVSGDQFAANNVTKALAGPGGEGIVYFFEVLNPAFMALPEYLKTHDYKNPTNPCDSPWQAGYNTTQHPFVWLQSHPRHFELFMMWLAQNREGLPLWLDVFPFEEEVGKDTTDETVLFVDIGSALGHQSIGLREKFPTLPGRLIIQDTAQVISAVKPSHGIEPMVYDFFTPQPIKGARAYYMRNIIHDHNDERCQEILKNTMSAMTEDSVLLIDDMMLPEAGSPWRATQLDMTMLTCLAAKERSEKEWYALLDSVGLKVVKVWKYTEECDDCIIVAKPEKFAQV